MHNVLMYAGWQWGGAFCGGGSRVSETELGAGLGRGEPQTWVLL